MKAVLAILLGVFATIALAEMGDDKKSFEECKAMEKATDEDVQQFMSKSLQTPTAKCFAACAYEKFGVITNGKISPDGLKACVTRHHSGMDRGVINDIVNDCQSVASPDRCELGAQLVECLSKSLANHPH